jgi:hypothetical protein
LWASAPSSFAEPEWIELTWDKARDIGEIQILFDSSLHFHFSQSWQGYPVNAIPSLVKNYRIIAEHFDGKQTVVAEVAANFQRNRRHSAELTGVTRMRLEILATHGLARAQVYAIRVMEKQP